MSGQTIEIINTDAEGRLVLADLLWYVQDKCKPKFMIDLATLTGAIMVSLGQENAGLFSNDDDLSEKIAKAAKKTGEKVWRLPLGPAYDKLIDSKFADMKNTGGRHGGAITAAQFLQRFVNGTPWAHIDIAGVGMNSPANEINQSWRIFTKTESNEGVGRPQWRKSGSITCSAGRSKMRSLRFAKNRWNGAGESS
jgi:leucyl aminopeptidase